MPPERRKVRSSSVTEEASQFMKCNRKGREKNEHRWNLQMCRIKEVSGSFQSTNAPTSRNNTTKIQEETDGSHCLTCGCKKIYSV
jgi:hypothetical protein